MLSKFYACLTEVENLAGKNDKVAAIRRHLDAEPGLGKLFELALSPYITFGVAKLPKTVCHLGEPLPAWDVLLDRLARRELTGNAALDQIGRLRFQLDLASDEAFSRILLKDLRCGVSESSVNKAKPGTVPVFSCQLAMSEMPELATLKFPIYAEPKWDGVRTIAMKRDGVVKLFSRNGLEFENFNELANALTALPEGTVLDGEVISSLGFAALMTRTKAARGKAVSIPLEYRVFDGLPAVLWGQQRGEVTLSARRIYAADRVADVNSPLVTMGEARLCNSVAEVEAFYADQLERGLEGIMLKSPDGLYTFKRNKTWLKLKPFDTADLKVVDVIEGQGKYAGSLGALICQGEHQGKAIHTEVGSGFTDEQRHALWEGWSMGGLHGYEDVDGRTVEVRYQEITKAQDSVTWSLRFPTFVRFRDDK